MQLRSTILSWRSRRASTMRMYFAILRNSILRRKLDELARRRTTGGWRNHLDRSLICPRTFYERRRLHLVQRACSGIEQRMLRCSSRVLRHFVQQRSCGNPIFVQPDHRASKTPAHLAIRYWGAEPRTTLVMARSRSSQCSRYVKRFAPGPVASYPSC
jgi:hypothetical protein